MLRKSLLLCGFLASLLYVGIDLLAAILYPGYHSIAGRAISELMASGAPTEELVDPLFLLYDVLMLAFAVGVWMSSPRKRVRVTAGLLFAYGAIGFLGPTVGEMNLRGSGGFSGADAVHVALTGVLVLFIVGSLVAGASIWGRSFRLYSYATLVATIAFGVLTSFAARAAAAGEPTPWLGISERIGVGVFLLWVAVLAIALLRTRAPDAGPTTSPAMPPRPAWHRP